MGKFKYGSDFMKNNIIKKKLNVSEYVFEIDGKDIINCNLEYSLTETIKTYYKDKSEEEIYNPIINISLEGVDYKANNESWISFELNIGLKELNKYTSIPTNIISKLSKGESFIKRPNQETSEELYFYIPTQTQEDMYNNLSSIWVSKLDKNIFLFKICIPSEQVFAYFRIDFN